MTEVGGQSTRHRFLGRNSRLLPLKLSLTSSLPRCLGELFLVFEYEMIKMGRTRNQHLTRAGPAFHRNRKFSARAFYLVAIAISVLVIFSFLLDLPSHYARGLDVEDGPRIDSVGDTSGLRARALIEKRNQEVSPVPGIYERHDAIC
jgi:hypothetical protein